MPDTILNRNDYNTCVDQHSDALFRFCLHFLRDVEPARDTVQDCFEKLWINKKQVPVEKAKSWLFTCANHLMLNQVKRNKIRQQHLDSLYWKQTQSSEKQFENQQLIALLVADLPPLQKSILLLRDLEGYAYQEIGELLSLTEAQVKVYLFRARLKVKKRIKGQFVLAS
ncbi:MAG: RNA polymerase sigma factor [Flavobacteriales bacterium]